MEPRQFGNYTLLERVSHGGMAEVFRAKSFGEAGFEREVALKLLLPSMASDQEFVDMLIDEAKIAGQLNHANIAQIFDLGAVDGRYYIVQEFVQGQDLRAILKRKSVTRSKLKISTACHITIKICEGLHYAHNKQDHFGKRLNLVHRDISPHNILISNEGEVKIIDFGIAKADGRSTQTMAGLVKGKFAYMSPEQIRGLPVDHRSDVFATGILLHEMLTSRPLFQAGTEFETLKRARAANAQPPSVYNVEVPPALDAIVLKALARHVDDRYQSARELRDELWAFARANNAFAGHEQLANMNPNAPPEDSGSSIQIDLASEVREVPEDFDVARAATSPDLGDEETVLGDDFSAQAAEQFADDDYGEDESENRTVVDPHFAGIAMSGPDETDLDDLADDELDAQWAADLGGPLATTPMQYAVPARSHALPREARNPLEEETTSSRGDLVNERPTDQFPASHPPAIDDADTAQEATARDRRASTVPAMPAKAAAMTPKRPSNPYADSTTTKRDRGMALAKTEPISQALLARAASNPSGSPDVPPTPAVSMPPVSAADVGAPHLQRAAAAPATASPNTGPVGTPRPASQQYGSAPAPMPQQYGSGPAPTQQQYGSAPAPMPQQYGSAPAPMPQQYGSAPAPMPQQYGSGPAPQPYGSAPAPTPQPYGSEATPMPQQPYGSGEMPHVRSDSGSAPLQMPSPDGNSGPMPMQGQQPGFGYGSSGRSLLPGTRAPPATALPTHGRPLLLASRRRSHAHADHHRVATSRALLDDGVEHQGQALGGNRCLHAPLNIARHHTARLAVAIDSRIDFDISVKLRAGNHGVGAAQVKLHRKSSDIDSLDRKRLPENLTGRFVDRAHREKDDRAWLD